MDIDFVVAAPGPLGPTRPKTNFRLTLDVRPIKPSFSRRVVAWQIGVVRRLPGLVEQAPSKGDVGEMAKKLLLCNERSAMLQLKVSESSVIASLVEQTADYPRQCTLAVYGFIAGPRVEEVFGKEARGAYELLVEEQLRRNRLHLPDDLADAVEAEILTEEEARLLHDALSRATAGGRSWRAPIWLLRELSEPGV